MIELKLQLGGAEQLRLTSEYLAKMAEVEAADVPCAFGVVEETVKRVVEEAKAEEPTPKKRGRARRGEATAAPAPEPAPNITANPEDRQPVEEAEIAGEAPDEFNPQDTEQAVRDALGKLVGKMGMAEAMTWVKANTGFSKMSEIVAGVADGKTTFAKVVAAIEAEIAE